MRPVALLGQICREIALPARDSLTHFSPYFRLLALYPDRGHNWPSVVLLPFPTNYCLSISVSVVVPRLAAISAAADPWFARVPPWPEALATGPEATA